jgi:hypothetical protein
MMVVMTVMAAALHLLLTLRENLRHVKSGLVKIAGWCLAQTALSLRLPLCTWPFFPSSSITRP